MHRHNAKTVAWFAGVMVACLAFIAVVVCADRADAHGTHRSAGFEPSEATLRCIRGPWHGDSMESGGNYASNDGDRWRGGYQSDRGFEVAYAIRLIPAAHWHLWGSNTTDRADRWHPMIQDEMARNGARARGLSPWSRKVRARCPR